MLQLIYELRKNWRGRDGTGREKSKVLQEVLADLKMMMTKMKMITDHCPLPRFSPQPVTRSSKVRPENEIELDSVSK